MPIVTTLLQPESAKDTTKLIKIAKFKQQEIFNKKSKELPHLLSGDSVHMKLPGEGEWTPGKMRNLSGLRSYFVECAGKLYSRTIDNC